jgi:hypothetical protein
LRRTKVTIRHFIPGARWRPTEQFCRSANFSLPLGFRAPNAIDQCHRTRTHPASEERSRNAPNAFIDARPPSWLFTTTHFKPTAAILAGRDLDGFGEDWAG